MAKRIKRVYASRRAASPRSETYTPPPANLATLPNELLYIIRSYLPYEDLRDHVALQATCRRVRALYERDERFWERACTASGVGRPWGSPDYPYTIGKVTCREVAILAVNHRECCDIPTCQAYRVPDELREFGTTIRSPEDVYNAAKDRLVGFEATVDLAASEFHGLNVVHNEPRTLGEEPALILHAPGLCKFATTPPIQDFYVNALGFRLWVKNNHGVTIWDVLERLDRFRWEHFSLTRLFLTYRAHHHHLPSLDVFSWIDTTTLGQCLPYIYDVQREPLDLDEKLLAGLQQYQPLFPQFDPDLNIYDLVTLMEELCDRCPLKEFVRYFQRRFPAHAADKWLLDLLEFSPVERVLPELIFKGIVPCPRDNAEFNGLDFESTWMPRP